MHKSHNFMRVDISLPPGIMRDRALAERDFVTFPEIFFFSVLSKRCRAMWEAGSLDGFEELSVLSTHSLRPFIWSKCSEKLPTVQRRRDKHVQENRIGEAGKGEKRERRKDKRWETYSLVAHESLQCQANIRNTWPGWERWRGRGKGEKGVHSGFITVVYKSANSQSVIPFNWNNYFLESLFYTLVETTLPHPTMKGHVMNQISLYEYLDYLLYMITMIIISNAINNGFWYVDII